MVGILNMIGLDTFSWYKLISLYNGGYKEIMVNFLKSYEIFITHEVKDEFSYRFKNYEFLLKLVSILPTNLNKNNFNYDKFDIADISLLVYAEKINFIIVTEDHAMLAEGVTSKQNIIQFGDLMGLLYKDNFLDKRSFYKIVNILRKMTNITKIKRKQLLNIRN